MGKGGEEEEESEKKIENAYKQAKRHHAQVIASLGDQVEETLAMKKDLKRRAMAIVQTIGQDLSQARVNALAHLLRNVEKPSSPVTPEGCATVHASSTEGPDSPTTSPVHGSSAAPDMFFQQLPDGSAGIGLELPLTPTHSACPDFNVQIFAEESMLDQEPFFDFYEGYEVSAWTHARPSHTCGIFFFYF